MAEAIADARKNAELNGISNATFVQGDLNKIDDSFGNDFPKPDIVISGYLSLQFYPLRLSPCFIAFNCRFGSWKDLSSKWG